MISRIIIFCVLNWTFLQAEYPVDISYMVADFKYSQEHGLKICEVQHGALSALNGDNGIALMVANFFEDFPMKKWTAGLVYSPLKNSLKGWEFERSIKTLSRNPEFLECAVLSPEDPSSIVSYAGIVYATCEVFKDFDLYPGVLFIDAAILPYWIDKYKMNVLFNHNDELKKYKADWELYPKKYDPMLATRIQEMMPSELYVIKPRSEFLGNGVIIVEKKDLDKVLQMILEPKDSLRKHPEKCYYYWYQNKDDTFIIEKYYESDVLEGYDPTMRIAFIMKYDQGNMTYHFLGSYWKLPLKTLEEEGTLNEKRKTLCEAPFYRPVDPELLEEVNAQMERAMLLLYEIMLNETSML